MVNGNMTNSKKMVSITSAPQHRGSPQAALDVSTASRSRNEEFLFGTPTLSQGRWGMVNGVLFGYGFKRICFFLPWILMDVSGV